MDTTVYYNGQANNDTVDIVKRVGQYIISFDAVTKGNGTAQTVTAEIHINGQVRASGVAYGNSVNIPLSNAYRLAINDTVKFIIKGSLFPPTLSNCTRSLAYIAPLTTLSGGLSLYTKSDLTASSKETVVNGLHGDGGDGFFLDDNTTLVNNEAIATIKPAFYRISAHIKINNTGPARYTNTLYILYVYVYVFLKFFRVEYSMVISVREVK